MKSGKSTLSDEKQQNHLSEVLFKKGISKFYEHTKKYPLRMEI